MASSEHKKVEIRPGDLVIISAHPIPGNEKLISKVINLLFEKGARVVYNDLADIHVSGHASQEELKLINRMANPKFFMPVHGEYRMLKRHSELAQELGMPAENIFVMQTGQVLELDHLLISVFYLLKLYFLHLQHLIHQLIHFLLEL